MNQNMVLSTANQRLYNRSIQPRALSIISNVLTQALMLAQGFWIPNLAFFFFQFQTKMENAKEDQVYPLMSDLEITASVTDSFAFLKSI